MDDLREKVARAIIAAFTETSPELADGMLMETSAWLGEADAAIAAVLDALKEPSEKMIDAGLTTGSRFGKAAMVNIHKTMLAAFREENGL